MVHIEQLKQLREETAVSAAECKKALEKAEGDIEKAKEILRMRGQELAGKKSAREAGQGIVESYIHPNKKIGVLLELRCESDFVARSEEFKKLAHELCLQVAAMKPLFLQEEDIPESFLDGERKIYREQFLGSGKPQKVMVRQTHHPERSRRIDQIVEGKLKKYKEEISLLSQLWIKDQQKTIKELVNDYIAKTGENIVVKRFTRYEI